jgi:hypothetical protein
VKRRQFIKATVGTTAIASTITVPAWANQSDRAIRVTRLSWQPIISADMNSYVGSNVNGPSLIRVPDWVLNPLGRYYLYFGHHSGDYIRLAYADSLVGPWRTHDAGVLRLQDSYFVDHIASPDVHVDHENRRITLFYHGMVETGEPLQQTRAAQSPDGLSFTAREDIVLDWYARLFTWKGQRYALTMSRDLSVRALISRYSEIDARFVPGPHVFSSRMRHSAALVRGHELFVFYSNVGDAPESILLSRIDLRGDWLHWTPTPPITVLTPEEKWEGADLPIRPSERGPAIGRVNAVRDPAIYVEDGRVYLLYAVAGESGIGIAEFRCSG